MKGMARLPGRMMIVLFVVLAVPTLILYSARDQLADVSGIEAAVAADEKVRRYSDALVLDAILEQKVGLRDDAFGLPSQAIDLFNERLSSGLVGGAYSEEFVAATVDYLESGNVSDLDVNIDVSTLLFDLGEGSGDQIASAIEDAVPQCGSDDQGLTLEFGGFSLPICVPESIDISAMAGRVGDSLNSLLGQGQEAVSEYTSVSVPLYGSDASGEPAVPASLKAMRSARLLSRLPLLGFVAAPAALLLAIALVSGGFANLFKDWGSALLLGGAFSYLTVPVGPFLIDKGIDLIDRLSAGATGVSLSNVITMVFTRVVIEPQGEYLRTIGGTAFITGAGLILLGWIIKALRPKRRD